MAGEKPIVPGTVSGEEFKAVNQDGLNSTVTATGVSAIRGQVPTSDGADGQAWGSGGNSAKNVQVGVNFTPALTDIGKTVTLDNGAGIAVTVPLNAVVAFPVGTYINFVQKGAGKPTFAGAGGVTIISKGGNLSIAAQGVGVTLWKDDTDIWYLFGDLIA